MQFSAEFPLEYSLIGGASFSGCVLSYISGSSDLEQFEFASGVATCYCPDVGEFGILIGNSSSGDPIENAYSLIIGARLFPFGNINYVSISTIRVEGGYVGISINQNGEMFWFTVDDYGSAYLAPKSFYDVSINISGGIATFYVDGVEIYSGPCAGTWYAFPRISVPNSGKIGPISVQGYFDPPGELTPVFWGMLSGATETV